MFGCTTAPAELTVDQVVQNIDKGVEMYAKTDKDLFGYSTEGGVLTVYRDWGKIKKIRVTLMGEMGQSSNYYYFDDEELIFLSSAVARYEEPFGEVAEVERNEYYFDGGTMLQWVDENKKDFPKYDSRFIDKQLEIHDDLNLFWDLAKVEGTVLPDNYDSIFEWLLKNDKELEYAIIKGYVNEFGKSSVFFYRDLGCEEDCSFGGKVLSPVDDVYRMFDLPEFDEIVRISSFSFEQLDEDEEDEIVVIADGEIIFDWNSEDEEFEEYLHSL